jgi:hypothetical protein
MLEISNVKVYDLQESVIASRNAMRLTPPEYTNEEFEKSLPRAIQLANTKNGSGHQTFLSGIRVSFDLKYPNYISPELQRYHWVDIVTSSSKMHRLTKMNMDACFNEYVTQNSVNQMKVLIKQYNENPTYERFMYVISNCPQGVELFMRVSTNYLQLKTIYHQRKHHKLKEDWGAFCKAIESLPYANEFIVGLKDDEYEQAKGN